MKYEEEKQKLLKEKDDLCLSKIDHETQMVAIKNLIRSGGRMPHDKYKQCCDSQNKHTKKQDPESQKSIVMDLVSLRQEYQNFAADGTRISSMRQMAAEFVLKLNPIIKRTIGSD